MNDVLKSLEQENVMIMLYTYGKVEGMAGSINAPKSSRMVFRMKDKENRELLNLFVETALKVSKKEKAHLCYTVVEKDADALIQVLQKYGFEHSFEAACVHGEATLTDSECPLCKANAENETEGILFTKAIALTKEETEEVPTAFDGIDCFMLWGTQGMSYKIGKGTDVVIRAFDKGEFLN